jgi:tripartite-type tricarboxylate transporter receptor subunit TctC
MEILRRQFLHLAAGAAVLPAVSRIARAQTYPNRPITLVVPYAAGGPTDAVARPLVERMRVILGQPIIIENLAGANGSIAAGRVARAASDGYTLIVGQSTTHVLNGATYALQYDVVNDFEPIAPLVTQPLLILSKKDLPANDLRSLIAWLRANADKTSQGTPGFGSTAHLFGVAFQNAIGVRWQIVPYRGAGPAMQDLIAGQIDMTMTTPINALTHVRSGAIKAYAVTVDKRLTVAPDIPSVDEAGLPGLYISNWFGLFAPKGTPKDVIGKLNAGVVGALADSTVRQLFTDAGSEISPRDQQTPEALRAFQKSEIEKWWPIIKAANIKGE